MSLFLADFPFLGMDFAIVAAVHTQDVGAKVFLFGSRVDDTKTGGDIDLLVVSSVIDRWQTRLIRIAIQDQLGEQKIDIVVTPSLKDSKDPFINLIAKDAVAL